MAPKREGVESPLHRWSTPLGWAAEIWSRRPRLAAPTRINPRSSSWLDRRLTGAVECHPGHGTLANPRRGPDDEIEEGASREGGEWVGR
jgi:hypothetical protein